MPVALPVARRLSPAANAHGKSPVARGPWAVTHCHRPGPRRRPPPPPTPSPPDRSTRHFRFPMAAWCHTPPPPRSWEHAPCWILPAGVVSGLRNGQRNSPPSVQSAQGQNTTAATQRCLYPPSASPVRRAFSMQVMADNGQRNGPLLRSSTEAPAIGRTVVAGQRLGSDGGGSGQKQQRASQRREKQIAVHSWARGCKGSKRAHGEHSDGRWRRRANGVEAGRSRSQSPLGERECVCFTQVGVRLRERCAVAVRTG